MTHSRRSGTTRLRPAQAVLTAAFVTAASSASSPAAFAQCLMQHVTLEDPPPSPDTLSFGDAMDVSGGRAVITGTWSDPWGEHGSGFAFVFRRDGTHWTKEATLSASDGSDRDFFGDRAAISGDRVAVRGGGAVYVFHRENGQWIEAAKLLPWDPELSRFFGSSLDLYGDVLVVGDEDNLEAGDRAGAAYVFRYRDGQWAADQKLLASDAHPTGGAFGRSVAVHGDSILVGDSGHAVGKIGSGWVYAYNHNGAEWVEEDIFIGNDTAIGDGFGRDVKLYADWAIVGAPYHDVSPWDDAGAAYAFRRVGTAWMQEAKLMPYLRTAELIGFSLAISERYLLVGDFNWDGGVYKRGRAHFYWRTGNTWIEQKPLMPETPVWGEMFGYPVALDDDIAMIASNRIEEPSYGTIFYFNLSGPCRSLADFAELQRCFSVAGAVVEPSCLPVDLDADGDVDLEDYRGVVRTFVGPGE